MAVLGKDTKQPHEALDWDVDWSEWMPERDSIDCVDAEVRLLSGVAEPALVVERVQNTVDRTKVWLAGGAHGSKWRVQLRAFTLGGRTKEAEFDISVKEV